MLRRAELQGAGSAELDALRHVIVTDCLTGIDIDAEALAYAAERLGSDKGMFLMPHGFVGQEHEKPTPDNVRLGALELLWPGKQPEQQQLKLI